MAELQRPFRTEKRTLNILNQLGNAVKMKLMNLIKQIDPL